MPSHAERSKSAWPSRCSVSIRNLRLGRWRFTWRPYQMRRSLPAALMATPKGSMQRRSPQGQMTMVPRATPSLTFSVTKLECTLADGWLQSQRRGGGPAAGSHSRQKA